MLMMLESGGRDAPGQHLRMLMILSLCVGLATACRTKQVVFVFVIDDHRPGRADAHDARAMAMMEH